MENSYLWLKGLHIIAVISWMAGQLYLPRLFVYHASVAPGSEADQLLQTMERRLLRAIMTPAMIATFILGFLLAMKIHAFDPQNGAWLHVKLLLVLLLAASHGFMSATRKRFMRGENFRTPTFYKIFNEIQTILMVVIVMLVVVKPF